LLADIEIGGGRADRQIRLSQFVVCAYCTDGQLFPPNESTAAQSQPNFERKHLAHPSKGVKQQNTTKQKDHRSLLFFSQQLRRFIQINHCNKKMKADTKKKVLFGNEESSKSSSSDDSSSSSSSEEVEKLTVNKKFAKAYESRKQKEELKQMQDRGAIVDSDDSSSEEEDEDAQLITPSVNLQFIKTIKALRNKDSSIYDPQTQFFEADGNEDSNEKPEKKRKPKNFKDVIREQVLEQMDGEDAEKEMNDDGEDAKPSKFAYDGQQEELRKAFLKESKMASDSESDDDNDWMIVKKKGVAKVDDPETEKKVAEELKTLEESFKGGKEKEFKDPRGEVKDGDQFLLDYIKNKKWIDKSHEADDYSEDEDKSGDESDALSMGEIDKADDFEANYNFRFEQAAAETATSGAAFSVQSYARAQTMNTLRRKDDTRRDKRLARIDRKAAERKAKEEQLKRLKNAKKAEMNQKLSKVKNILGEVGDDAVDEVAIMKMLEGDYDPEKFEEAMKVAYGDDFYQKDDAQWKSDKDVVDTLKNDEDVVDVVGQDDLDGGLYDNYDEGEGDDNNGEDEEYPDEEIDEDDDINNGEQEEETDLQKKIKTKMQEELYKLDYEDVVAGMPTRFKYRQVEANDYGLSTEEILLARDTTLKQFVSLKKMAPYNESGEYFTDSKKRRRFREALKAEIEEEQEKDEPVDEAEPVEVDDTAEDGEPKKKKRRRIKKGKKSKDKENESENPDIAEDKDGEEDQENAPESEKVGDEAENEEGKKKRRKKKGKKSQSSDPIENDAKEEEEKTTNDAKEEEEKTTEKTFESTKTSEKKKKRKNKKNAIAGLSASRLGAYGL
jgi:protein KRI1